MKKIIQILLTFCLLSMTSLIYAKNISVIPPLTWKNHLHKHDKLMLEKKYKKIIRISKKIMAYYNPKKKSDEYIIKKNIYLLKGKSFEHILQTYIHIGLAYCLLGNSQTKKIKNFDKAESHFLTAFNYAKSFKDSPDTKYLRYYIALVYYSKYLFNKSTDKSIYQLDYSVILLDEELDEYFPDGVGGALIISLRNNITDIIDKKSKKGITPKKEITLKKDNKNQTFVVQISSSGEKRYAFEDAKIINEYLENQQFNSFKVYVTNRLNNHWYAVRIEKKFKSSIVAAQYRQHLIALLQENVELCKVIDIKDIIISSW